MDRGAAYNLQENRGCAAGAEETVSPVFCPRFSGFRLFGQLPARKLLLVHAWIEIHKEELLASWHAGRLTGDYMKLEALR